MNITRKRTWRSAVLFFLLAAALTLLAGQVSAESHQLGDIITFGAYEQNNNSWDGLEDIEWIVLSQKEDRILIISRFCIDSQPYNSTLESVTWENSSLRKWLNGDFFDTAFSQEEQTRILSVENENLAHSTAGTSSGRATKDRVFVLSQEEVKGFFHTNSARKASPTAYAMAEGAYRDPNSLTSWWWLRTNSFLGDHVTYVTCGGDASSEGREVTRRDAGVRPVMWISTETAPEDNEADAPAIPTESTPSAVANVQFDFVNNEGSNYAYIFGRDTAGQLLWSYKSDIYRNSTQLPKVSEILQHGDRYYFCEDGQIVALDISSGKVLWRNVDFGGACPIGEVDNNGILYLSGYEGPDFYAIDGDGNTLCRIDKLDPDFYWPMELKTFDRFVELTFASNTDQLFRIDTTDGTFECTRVKNDSGR